MCLSRTVTYCEKKGRVWREAPRDVYKAGTGDRSASAKKKLTENEVTVERLKRRLSRSPTLI